MNIETSAVLNVILVNTAFLNISAGLMDQTSSQILFDLHTCYFSGVDIRVLKTLLKKINNELEIHVRLPIVTKLIVYSFMSAYTFVMLRTSAYGHM